MLYDTSTRSSTQAAKMRENSCSICPECGGLACLCRPRFFAGQLLTEEDLNRLEHYIIEKNKLHNRYLHGWGVVSGLAVHCNPCTSLVTVKSGYALSPCGEDIVLCKDETVDVCSLISRQQPACEPPAFGYTSGDCQDTLEDWVLAVRYDEKPARGITALRGSSALSSCARCNGGNSCCHGSSSCGCACHTQTNASTKNGYKSSQKPVSAQCEPTVTCEGYLFETYKAPVRDRRKVDYGPLVDRFVMCVDRFLQVIPPPPSVVGANFTSAQAFAWCCSLKSNLQEFFTTNEVYDCQILQKLAAFICPDPGQFETGQQYIESIAPQLQVINLEFERYVIDCFCTALLPCPEPVCGSRVPLATITIRKRDCQIQRVCNWDTRKVVFTFPDLEYWLSFLPFERQLRECLRELCCQPFGFRGAGVGVTTSFVSPGGLFNAEVANQGVLAFLGQILTALGQCTFRGGGIPNHVADMLKSFVPTGAVGTHDEEIDTLKGQVADLQRQVEELTNLLKNK